MELLPAILIGGPPHSGKSVLTYSLTQALRQRGVAHYVLRAAPDGEGDWSNEAAQKLVREIRYKSEFTSAFVDFVCDSLAGRHLPLLVDVGGRPTREQERIFDYCTHAVLLTPEELSRTAWQVMLARYNLPIIAEITSQLTGEGQISGKQPILRGVITGLERGQTATGPLFDALVKRISTVFDYDADELRRIHQAMAQVETVVDLDRLARRFSVPLEGARAKWEPKHLAGVLSYLPEGKPLGLYGRGPNWLYGAVSLLPRPEAFWQFDARLGWVAPRPLALGKTLPGAPLQVRIDEQPSHTHLDFLIPAAHLDFEETLRLTVPELEPKSGVILSGKIPHWLYTALTLTYASHTPWVAIYQPPLGCAIVVSAKDDRQRLGDRISL